MYPTCSAFGMQALGRYGALEGLLMTADRLLRDNPYARYPRMPLNDREYLYDPVEDHVLW
jgi:putative component of membrane protein insertase Oxa1/YidC/SpoIIIJ protein YidD